MKSKLEQILLFLTVLFLPTQLGKHFWPQFSFIYSLPIDYLSPVIYFWDLLVILLIISFLAQHKPVNRTALNIFLLFMLTQIVSLIPFQSTGLNLGAGLVRAQQYLIAGLFGVYLASSNLKTQIPKLLWPFLLAVFFQSALAVLQFIKGGTLGLWILGERSFSLSTPAIAKFDFYGREFLRPYGTFPHPNVLAAFLVIIPLVSFWLARLAKQVQNLDKKDSGVLTALVPRMTGVSMVLAGVATFLTAGRVAILAGLLSAFWLFGKKGKIMLLAVVLILLPILYTRFQAAFIFDNLSMLRREELSVVALKIFASSPILGVGLNNFIPEAANELLVGPSRFLQPVHNIFLLSLSETGLIGLAGLLILIGYPILRLIKLPPVTYTLKPILLVWIIVIFLGMFDHYFLTLPQGYRLLFFIWGISLSSSLFFEKERKN